MKIWLFSILFVTSVMAMSHTQFCEDVLKIDVNETQGYFLCQDSIEFLDGMCNSSTNYTMEQIFYLNYTVNEVYNSTSDLSKFEFDSKLIEVHDRIRILEEEIIEMKTNENPVKNLEIMREEFRHEEEMARIGAVKENTTIQPIETITANDVLDIVSKQMASKEENTPKVVTPIQSIPQQDDGWRNYVVVIAVIAVVGFWLYQYFSQKTKTNVNVNPVTQNPEGYVDMGTLNSLAQQKGGLQYRKEQQAGNQVQR